MYFCSLILSEIFPNISEKNPSAKFCANEAIAQPKIKIPNLSNYRTHLF